ncbi:fibroblast growth factor 22-like [Montipora foliosa]|uniref:fibroblast growth factor 22-like n=1 Tax=Montipora foliosa TaxID=591990 RepID=UPI0035F16B7C
MGMKMILLVVVMFVVTAKLSSAHSSIKPKLQKDKLDRRYTISPHMNNRGSCEQGPTHSRLAHLWSKLRFHLAMLFNGTVHGVNDSYCQENNQCLFELQSCAPSIVRIKHVTSGRFIAISSITAKVYTTLKSHKHDTLLIQELLPNGFTVFHSARRNREGQESMFLALKKNGAPKNASKTSQSHKSAHFMVMLCSGNGETMIGNSRTC